MEVGTGCEFSRPSYYQTFIINLSYLAREHWEFMNLTTVVNFLEHSTWDFRIAGIIYQIINPFYNTVIIEIKDSSWVLYPYFLRSLRIQYNFKCFSSTLFSPTFLSFFTRLCLLLKTPSPPHPTPLPHKRRHPTPTPLPPNPQTQPTTHHTNPHATTHHHHFNQHTHTHTLSLYVMKNARMFVLLCFVGAMS